MEGLPNLVGYTINNYRILRLIDRGRYGIVYVVEEVKNKNRYAMKILYPSAENEREFNHEVAVYNLLSSDISGSGCNKHIVCLQDAFVHNIVMEEEITGTEKIVYDNIYFVLVLEFMDGDLRDIIDSSLLIGDAYIILKFMKGLLEGLAFIHSQGLAHKDIKLENILYKTKKFLVEEKEERKQIVLKYVDFGLSCTDETHPELLDKIQKCGLQGNPTFMSQDYAYAKPDEITLRMAQKDDIWALGVVFRLMAVGRHPIAKINDLIKSDNVKEGDIIEALQSATFVEDFTYDTGHPKLDTIITQVIRTMSALDEDDRPTAQELLNYIYEKD